MLTYRFDYPPLMLLLDTCSYIHDSEHIEVLAHPPHLICLAATPPTPPSYQTLNDQTKGAKNSHNRYWWMVRSGNSAHPCCVEALPTQGFNQTVQTWRWSWMAVPTVYPGPVSNGCSLGWAMLLGSAPCSAEHGRLVWPWAVVWVGKSCQT